MPRPYTDMPPTRPVWCAWAFHGRRFIRLRDHDRRSAVNLRHLRFGIACVRSIRGQPSGSMNANLEVFTNRARHTSPLHRYAPDKTGTACRWRSMGVVSFVWRTISAIGDKSASSVVRHSPRAQYSRSTIGVDGRSPGGLYNLGEACLAPAQICPRQDRYGVPLAFHGRRFIRLRDHDRRSAVNLRHLRFAFAVNHRGRCSLTWRSLHPGRRTRRPYPDMPPTGPVWCAWAFQGAVPVRPCA